jgi:FkbM family methyltransferase
MSAASTAASILPDSVFTRLIAYAHRRFEPELARVVSAFPRGGNALDVGAWYGPWTYWLSRRANHVTAFEPNPDVAAVLERTVAPNVEVIRAAASDRARTATLTLPVGGRGTEGRASLEGIADGDRTVDVVTVAIDDLDLADVSLVKVDVEGHELAALQGATGLLEAQHPVLVVEIEERHGGIAPTVDLLTGLGYRGQVLVDGHWLWLDEFDLAGHQRLHETTATPAGGYLRIVARGPDRYINNVVFTHPASSWTVG